MRDRGAVTGPPRDPGRCRAAQGGHATSGWRGARQGEAARGAVTRGRVARPWHAARRGCPPSRPGGTRSCEALVVGRLCRRSADAAAAAAAATAAGRRLSVIAGRRLATRTARRANDAPNPRQEHPPRTTRRHAPCCGGGRMHMHMHMHTHMHTHTYSTAHCRLARGGSFFPRPHAPPHGQCAVRPGPYRARPMPGGLA